MGLLPPQCHLATPMGSLRENSSAGLLVEFHQHATGLHVPDRRSRRPNTVAGFIDVACAAPSKPPATTPGAAATRQRIIVAVWSAKLHSVRLPITRSKRGHQRVAGVSAVPGHRQTILTNLITDGERRVFSRVPQTVSALNLNTNVVTDTLIQFLTNVYLGVSGLVVRVSDS